MRKFSLALLVIVAIGSLAYAQNIDFNIMGTGARARGMGGAFIGVADDATAVGWNPAGIAQLEKPEASAVALFNMKSITNEGIFTDDPTWNFKETESVNHFAPAFGSLILPMKAAEKNVVFAVAYQRLIDFGYVHTKDTTDAGITYTSLDKMTGGVDAITPAAAIQITPQIMVGAAGNIIIRGGEYTEEITSSDNSYNYNWTQNFSYSGFNFNTGILATFNKINIGASFRFPFDLKEESEWDESGTYTTAASGDGPVYTYNFPLMMGFGVALKPTDKLTLAADFETRKYSNTNAEWEYMGYTGTDTMDWQDCNQFRVGLEYIMSGTNAVFPIRLGFRTDPKTTPSVVNNWDASYNLTSTDTTTLNGKVFTAGFGLVMGKLMLDFAYEMSTGEIFYKENNWGADNTSWTWKDSEVSHNIMASAIIHF
jgi:hypothetical protein